eukprot:TRINITY_DN8006_c0_g1_i1.p1 TRINITY_DN8006_c0_g1~~TRINITY_DN8006_c0_g1_i1.p1  ORF type:complete len:126 (-),score=31.96 TRINITY_DN8006_c0_g1_i1:255-632(-)
MAAREIVQSDIDNMVNGWVEKMLQETPKKEERELAPLVVEQRVSGLGLGATPSQSRMMTVMSDGARALKRQLRRDQTSNPVVQGTAEDVDDEEQGGGRSAIGRSKKRRRKGKRNSQPATKKRRTQ